MAHQIPPLKCFTSRLAVVFAQSIEAGFFVDNKDVVGAPTGDTQLRLSDQKIVLPTKLSLMLKVQRYVCTFCSMRYPREYDQGLFSFTKRFYLVYMAS